MLKSYFIKLFDSAYKLNQKNIKVLCRRYGKKKKWLDLGCDDGAWTKEIASGRVEWHGIEVVEGRAKLSREKGIKTIVSSLEKKLPYKNETFDLIHSNQVIEHLFDIDFFISEIKRVLKKGGMLIVSTENPASWHNIFALILGWQNFSAANISVKKLGIGNPLAIHSGKMLENVGEGRTASWTHNKLLTPKALIELLKLYGFKIVEVKGAGYHPLPSFLGSIDINHSHFYTIAAKKE